MNVLLLSTGGGGGNILRSLKTIFRRDLIAAQKSDPRYAERLRRAVATRFLDTNEFSLLDVPKDERVLIGAATTRRLGSMHNPDVAAAALQESKREVEALMAPFSVVVLIGTGGKGTGAGTMFPLAQIGRAQKKLVIPIFVRPSFERHEVEKRRYDHALKVTAQFDSAKIRIVEILNDGGYVDADPQPQTVVWERMNRPIARGLRGLLYVLSDLSQVDPSDLSVLFAGPGRLRIGFSEIDPAPGQDPTSQQVEEAVGGCWENLHYAFDHHVGTSLICVAGEWSNVVDAKIKGRFATLAHSEHSHTRYNPLYARVLHVPRPWGVTALFAEDTGNHPPAEIDWRVDRQTLLAEVPSVVRAPLAAAAPSVRVELPKDIVAPPPTAEPHPAALIEETTVPVARSFGSVWEFALALNRSDPAAIALASDASTSTMPVEGAEVRRLLSTFWFRSLFPRLSRTWRERLLDALVQGGPLQNHPVTIGRRTVHINELSYADLKQIVTEMIFPDAIRSDLQLLITVATLWGEEAVKRFEFTQVSENQKPSRLGSWMQALRSSPAAVSQSEPH